MKKGKIAAYIAACLLPAAAMLLGLWWLCNDYIVTLSFALAFFVFPALAIAFCVLLIRARFHPALRAVLCVVILVLAAILSFGLMVVGHFSTLTTMKGEEALEAYGAVAADAAELPAASELGEPESVEFYHFFDIFAIYFDSDCDILICTYDEEEYARQKEMLDTICDFRQEPAEACGYTVEPVVTVDGYEFRMLEFSERFDPYPKKMVYVAACDETGEIVCLYYTDGDLDYVDDMEDHIRNSFGWKYIR